MLYSRDFAARLLRDFVERCRARYEPVGRWVLYANRSIARLVRSITVRCFRTEQKTDLREHVASEFGAASAEHYWSFIEDLRDELGYVALTDVLEPRQRW